MNQRSGFPDMTKPESQKDEQYHKDFILSIVKNSIHGGYGLTYSALNQCYEYYNGTNTGDEFKFLQEAENGDVLPAKWISYNKIKVKVDILLGELAAKGYRIDAVAFNKEAIQRKLMQKNLGLINIRNKELFTEVGNVLGYQIMDAKSPDDEDEYELWFESEYKDKAEQIIKRGITNTIKRNNWDYQRIALMRDVIISGRCFVKNELVGGLNTIKRKDPRNMVFDIDATDDFLSDSMYFGEVEYMGLSEAVSKYGLSKEEQLKIIGNTSNETYNGILSKSDIASMNDCGMNFVKKDEMTGHRVMVFTAEWKEFKKVKFKKSEDAYGNIHYKRVKDTYKGDDAISKDIEIWRKGTLVGGVVMKEWGERKNHPRFNSSLSKTSSSYSAYLPNYINYRTISKVEQLQGLQDLKNITMYNIQLAMARAGAKGFIYDTSQCPDDWDVDTVIKYLKTVGIAFINSKKDGIPSQFNQFSTIDMTLSSSVSQYLEISKMIDTEMDRISGINDARQGVSSASQAVGVTQAALIQSNMATETLSFGFAKFSNIVFTNQAQLIKMTWTNKDMFANIIGDEGVDFINDSVDLSLDDFNIYIETLPPILEDKQMINQMVTAALQAGKIDFIDAIKVLKEKDIDFAIKKFEKTLYKKQKEAQAMQEQQMRMQAEQAQAMEAQRQQAEYQKAMDSQQAKSQFDIEKEREKTKGKIDEKAIDLMIKEQENRF